MFTVIEMQDGTIASNSWTYGTKEEAEVKMYHTLAAAVVSDVPVHTVMMVDEHGNVHECRSYTHETE